MGALDTLEQLREQLAQDDVAHQRALADRDELHRQALERQDAAHLRVVRAAHAELEAARRDREVALDAAAGAHIELAETTAAQQRVVDRMQQQLEDAQRELEQLRAGGDYTGRELEGMRARRDGLLTELQEVRAHLEHVLGQLREERDEHASLLRAHAVLQRQVDEGAEGVLLETEDTGGLVLVRLDQPGRMVTITSTPYTEDVPDEQSDLEHAEQQEARHACSCPPAVQGVGRVNLGHRRGCRQAQPWLDAPG